MSEFQYSELDIAIIGMAGRFPDAENVDELWRNLAAGHCAVTDLSAEALRQAGVSAEVLQDPAYVRRGIPFAGMAEFDAGFFGYSPKEATLLDPQQRHFLQTCWHALEHAGQGEGRDPHMAVFAGCGVPVYLLQNLLPQQQQQDITSLLALMNSNDKDSLASRVSYELDLTGPAITVQTACSTSLVAVHLACRSLQNYECNAALAGGVWLNTNHQQGYHAPAGGSLSPRGQLSPFSQQADGILIGSGSAAVVLKRMNDALADGDHILAVIKGSAVNNDGRDKIGYTAPSVSGQAAAIKAAYAFAEIEPHTVTYVEAHGTGTRLGDPVEVAALSQVFTHQQQQYCALGSIKANIGHLDAAAGVAGLIKVIQALRHQQIPGCLHAQPLSPAINFAQSPFYIPSQTMPWLSDGPRRAGLSSLGMGGTNVHLVLEEFVQPQPATAPVPMQAEQFCLLPISAADDAGLQRLQQKLRAQLLLQPEQFPQLVAQLQHQRMALPVRHCLVAKDVTAAIAALHDSTSGTKAMPCRVGLLFSGQGSQYATMAHELRSQLPAFRQAFDEALGLVAQPLQDELALVFAPGAEQLLLANQQLNQTRLTQPALFIVAYAMAKCYQAHGVVIAAMLGHSVGEYVAACLAGVMDLATAIRLVSARGEALQQMAPGAMLSVMADQASLLPYLNQQLDIAALNTATQTVVAGHKDAIRQLQQRLTEQGIACSRLHVSHAFHSQLTEPAISRFAPAWQDIVLQPPQLPFVSNVTGDWITTAQATSVQYWLDHIRQPVNFMKAVSTLASSCNILLEAGPGDTLIRLARQVVADPAVVMLHSIAHARELNLVTPPFYPTLARLWSLGCGIDWTACSDKPYRQAMLLPAYPFARTEYWCARELNSAKQPTVLKEVTSAGMLYQPLWQQSIQPALPQQWQGRHIVVIAVDQPVVTAMLQALQQAGAVVTVIWYQAAATEWRQIDNHHYVAALDSLAGCSALLGELETVSHMIDSRFLLSQPGSGYQLLLPLCQWAVAAHCFDLTVLASDLFVVSGHERTDALKATLLGLTRSLPLEIAQLQVRVLESDSTADVDYVVRQLMAASNLATEQEIACRGLQKFVLTQQPIPVVKVATRCTNGIALITGGLGGIGLALAKQLAAAGYALILQTRQTFPAAELWQELLQDQTQSTVRLQQLRVLTQLQQAGTQVLVMQADVLEPESLQSLVEQASEQLGSITLVVHAAGMAGGGLVAQLSPFQLEQTQAAKVKGTDNLLQVFARHRLTAMVLCSSLAAVLGALAQSDYSAANLYLDSIARQPQPFPVLSLNWDAWQNTGMTRGLTLGAGFGLTEQVAVQLFSQALNYALATGVSQLYCTSADWSSVCRMNAETVMQLRNRLFQQKASNRPALTTAFEPAASEIELKLAALWAEFLGFSQIGVFDSLFELGGDSLLAVQLLARVRQLFAINLEPAAFLAEPTIDNLAFLIETALVAELSAENSAIETN
jgi:acyl transferase domain-containing protein/acyl carrier protein